MREQTMLVLLVAQICTSIPLQSKVSVAEVRLSDSYLPVVMQVIAHLTDQMTYEDDDDTKPVSNPTSRKPSSTIALSTTANPLYQTTPFHKPGIFAPAKPPKPEERTTFVLLPVQNTGSAYSVIRPESGQQGSDPLLSPVFNEYNVNPITEKRPGHAALLPPVEFEALPPSDDNDDVLERAADFSLDDDVFGVLGADELNDNTLQYMSSDVRDILKLSFDPNDERIFKIDDRAALRPGQKKPVSQSKLRMLLLYDLLSREAKRQKLSAYNGYSKAVIEDMTETSSGGARSQLRHVLERMLARQDCEHQYANNRAKEMVSELKRDESLLSSQIRYLQPLVFTL